MINNTLTSMRAYKRARRETIHATLFGCFLLCCLSGLVIFSFTSSGPIILGTELNGDGSIEYMCLGNGCENKAAFHWNDK